MKTAMHFILSFCLATPMVACGPSENPQETPDELSATIGPAGGRIAGADAGSFAGVELVIPAGALAKPTRVTITGAYDQTPLPGLAESVGPQFQIDPPVALAKPASLTVPVDPGRVGRFGQTVSDCKVWIRDGSGWSREDQTGSSDTTVTIDLPSLTTVAAGVKLTSNGPVCGEIIFGGRAYFSTCATTCGGGLCVDWLGNPSPGPVGQWSTDGTSIYFLIPPSNGHLQMARFDIAAPNTTSLSGPMPLQSSVGVYGRNVAVETHDHVLAAIGTNFGQGNGLFFFDLTSSVAADLDPSELPLGGVVTPSGDSGRFVATANSNGVNTDLLYSTLSPTSVVLPFCHGSLIAPDRNPGSDTFWCFDTPCLGGCEINGVYVTNGHGSFPSVVAVPAGYYARWGGLAGGTTTDAYGYPAVAMLVTPNNTFQSNAVAMTPTYGNGVLTVSGLPFTAYDLAWDTAGGLWITSTNTPQIFYLSAQGNLSSFLLTSAAQGTTDFNNNLPREAIGLADGSAIVRLTSNGFVRVHH